MYCYILLLLAAINCCYAAEREVQPTNDFVVLPPPQRVCPMDVKHCPDGTRTMRNPNDDCRYYPCQNECRIGTAVPNIVCVPGGSQCPNGTYCVTGFHGSDTTDMYGWCCPLNRPCTDELRDMECDDGSQEAQEFMDEKQCILPQCPGTCPHGYEPTGDRCDGIHRCGLEQYCVNTWCCPSDFLAKLCHYERHIWKDYRLFNKKHKKLVTLAAKKDNKKKRVLLDELFETINCINELICKVIEKKRQILEGSFDRADIPMARCFWRWIRRIWEKAKQMEDILKKLRKVMKKRKERELIDCMQRLRASCLIASVENLNTLTFDTGDLIMYRLIPVSLNSTVGTAAYDICKKAEELGLLYHKLLNEYIKIYGFSILLFKRHNVFDKIPSGWFTEKIRCIHEFATLYYEIRECCGLIAENKITLNEVVKKLGAWLKKAMDLREKLRDVFPPNNLDYAVEMRKVATSSNLPALKVTELSELINQGFEGLFKNFDECIVKLRCLYLDMIIDHWSP